MSSIYNVCNAQTVESALVTSCHPETQFTNLSVNVNVYVDTCVCMFLCVNLLVAYVKVWPDLIDMSSRSSVC